LTLGAGQGKTFLALLLAERHARDDKVVCIVVPDPVSYDQYQQQIFNYCDESVRVLTARDLRSKDGSDS